ncbi:MAG TPA: response regulator [Sphingomicrobium sp.]|nr:response regulator [Sphingomicrobium sp.]
MDSEHLAGKRILVVEDSPILAEDLGGMLEELGCIVVGPTGSMATARELASEKAIDAAVLDLNIRGEKTFALAAMLAKRGIPFLLASGYADWSLPDELQEVPRLLKPYRVEMIQPLLEEMLATPR